MPIGVVNTQYGAVSGVTCSAGYTGITEFRGIPYAAPPVGKLRWAMPEPPKPWIGIRVCDTFAPAAIQTLLRGKRANEIYYIGFPELSEDCLYLNVITPAQTGEEKLPVYIWYHDGGMTNGYSHGLEVAPYELARKGIVVVQVGHRIGELGYMALPQLTEEQGQSGNYGVQDTVMAFNWVYDNIAGFGGDPEHITIGGQSGGTNKCCTLLQIPELKGKIKGVFNQSGLKWLYTAQTLEEAETSGKKFLERAGIDPQTPLNQLREMNIWDIHGQVPVPFIPGDLVLDGKVLKTPYSETLMDCSCGVNFMNSMCVGEADVYASTEWRGPKPFDTSDAFYTHFKELLGDLYDEYDFKNLVKVTDDNAWKTAVRLASMGLAKKGRQNFSRNLMANRIFAEKIKERYPDSKVYTYMFSHLLPKRTDWVPGDQEEILAPHGSDLWYAYASFRDGTPPVRPWRDCDYYVCRILHNYLANFIKNGDPNGDDLPEWPESGDAYTWLDLDTEPSVHRGIENALDELIFKFVKSYYKI